MGIFLCRQPEAKIARPDYDKPAGYLNGFDAISNNCVFFTISAGYLCYCVQMSFSYWKIVGVMQLLFENALNYIRR